MPRIIWYIKTMDAALKDHLIFNGFKYEWLGQSSVRITADDGFVIYTDPVFLDPSPPKAGLILISHHHVDHCLPEFVAAIRDEKTQSAAFHESYVKYCAQDIKGVRTVNIGQTIELSGAAITGVPAFTKRGFHTQGEGCGFLMAYRGRIIYFSGDTGVIPDMSDTTIDCAIVSVADNAYAINISEIIEGVKALKPALFIPVHFTPMDEPDPVVREGMFSTKDPRFFTSKSDPFHIRGMLEGTGIETALLRKLTPPVVS